MGILAKSSSVWVLLGLGFCGASCSSETDASGSGGSGGGLQCGEGTVAQGGYCVPMDASADGDGGGSAGAAGSGGVGGVGGSGTGGGTGGSPLDASVEAAEDAPEDAPKVTWPCKGKCGALGCGACPTIPVVIAQMPNGKAYGIDAYETTVAEYQVFLDDKIPLQTDEACKVNETYEPNPWVFEFPYPDMPIHAVDWCDAWAYCKWAGKRLCKGNKQDPADAAKSEWYNACTLGGTQEYPYGDAHDPDACPSEQAPHTPGSLVTCEGAYPGLFDMVGNMAEWTDACDKSDATYPGSCVIHGGGYSNKYTWFGCSGGADFRMSTRASLGIRCCQDQY